MVKPGHILRKLVILVETTLSCLLLSLAHAEEDGVVANSYLDEDFKSSSQFIMHVTIPDKNSR